MYSNQNQPQQYQQKFFIKNNTNSKLLLQNNKKEVFCKLGAKQVSFETFDYEELRNNPYIQILLSKGVIKLVLERNEEPKPVYQNYGQKYLVGTKCEIVGKHHLVITIEQYLPSTGQYKARLQKTGGLMTLSEKEIQPLTPEGEAQMNGGTTNNVDIVVNQGQGEQHTTAKNVKDIEAEALQELNNTDYETPQIITVSDEDKDAQLKEQEMLQRQYEMEQKKINASVKNIDQNKVAPVAQVPEDDEVEENIYIMKPNKKTNQKFASEVSTKKIIKDTMQQQQKIVEDMAKDLKEVDENPKDINEIMKNIPEKHQVWFVTFLNKDERKKKMTISLCKDVEKLNLIIKYCDEYESNLAKQRLQNLKSK